MQVHIHTSNPFYSIQLNNLYKNIYIFISQGITHNNSSSDAEQQRNL